MGADDYLGGSRGPRGPDYAAPLVGFQVGDRLAGLPDVYQKAQERNAFPNGLKNPDGSPMNYMDIMSRGAQVQGTGAMNYIAPLMQMQMYTGAGDRIAEGVRGAVNSVNGPSAPPGPQSDATSSIKTVGQYLREAGLKDPEIVQFAQANGVSPGSMMTGNTQAAVTSALDAFMRGGAPGQTPPPSSTEGASEVNQPARAASATDQNANFEQKLKDLGQQRLASASGASGSPAPVGGPDGSPAPQARATPFMPAQKQPVAEPAAGGGNLRPQQVAQAAPRSPVAGVADDPVIKRYDSAIANLHALQAQAWKNPQAAQAAAEAAKSLQAERDKRIDALTEAQKLTTKEKEAANPQVRAHTQQTEQDKLNAVRYSKLDTGVAANGATGDQMVRNAQDSRALLQTPGLYLGKGAEFVNGVKSLGAALGLADPTAAAAYEALHKTTASSILNQINQLKADSEEMGGAASRIFAPQITLMQKASQSGDVSLAGNLYLTTMQERMGKQLSAIADEAAKYKDAHSGHLDSGFERWLSNYVNQHPLLSKEEQSDPTLMGRRQFSSSKEAKKHGVQPGEIWRGDDGKYRHF